MRALRNLKEALRGLALHKSKTLLMTLGVVIGIASLTVIVAIGEGAKAKVLARISDMGFGPEAFSVAAGAGRLFFARTKTPTTLTLADVDDIRAMPTVQAAVPHQRQSMRMVYKRNNTFTRVYGVTPEWQSARLWKLSDGSFFTDEDMKRKAKVAVLGATPAGKLFGDEDPVGKMVRIGKVYFRVAGVLEKKGVTESGFDPDDRVIVPLSTSISRLFRQTWLFSIRIHTLDPSKVQETMEGVRQLLRKNHNLSVFAEDDFRFITPEGIMEWVTAEERALNRMLVLISAVSLLVGGIVIMNIMLVSIRERIREIGIRRCFGARRSDITQQFLFESIFVSILGGTAGCALGATISFILKKFHVLAAKPTWESFVVAFVFSAAVGLVFGIQPARKAASLSPEETIR